MAPVFLTVLGAKGWGRIASAVVLLIGFGTAVQAQISPGRLSGAHEFLDNPVKCFQCHALGAGRPAPKCLECHSEIRERLVQQRGFHAKAMRGETGEQPCATCHVEHLGADNRIVHWPNGRDRFNHREAGYPLLGRHAGLKCAQCHQAKNISAAERSNLKRADYNRTFLGLTAKCASCHQDRHSGQLGPDCARCHTVDGWKPVPGFNHDSAKFQLTGAHGRVACEKCHKPGKADAKTIEFTGLNFKDCAPCHNDPHGGALRQSCTSCHVDTSWKQLPQLSSFDHPRTVFPLLGRHAAVACQKCHKTANFQTPVAHARCLDCHQDSHRAQFNRRPDLGDCRACHTEEGWRKSTFNLAQHQQTQYPLTGKHAKVPCAQCHPPQGPETNYHPASSDCLDCHKDAHETQFAALPWSNQCESCHATAGFAPSTFTLAAHRKSRFPLPGAHAAVPCAGCHRPSPGSAKASAKYHFANIGCVECHQDPHRTDQSAASISADCTTCHTQNNWHTAIRFDHGTTRFQLEGAHRSVACSACHKPLPVLNGVARIPFAGAPSACAACHEDVHGGQFLSQGAGCERCHTATRWKPSQFDHERQSNFALTGIHREVPCHLCHKQRREIAGSIVRMYRETPRRCAECH